MRVSSGPLLFVIALGATALVGCSQETSGSAAASPQIEAADNSLTCPQILTEIGRQNSIIKQASAQARQGGQTGLLSNPTTQSADLGNADTGSAALVPGAQQETPGQLEADRLGNNATARANVLVALGRRKKCFL